ncbi:MAG: thiamine biosynthesis protein ThiS [Desulfuromonas sp.]|nr:MAG: thiamine biosynthesis protein ThiS [Desulfuromonas sp.]
MELKINGTQKTFTDEILTVTQLLEQLNLSVDQVVVELNRDILAPGVLSTTGLNNGDELELIQFVGGG